MEEELSIFTFLRVLQGVLTGEQRASQAQETKQAQSAGLPAAFYFPFQNIEGNKDWLLNTVIIIGAHKDQSCQASKYTQKQQGKLRGQRLKWC